MSESEKPEPTPCPLEGFEHISIVYPAEWTIGHIDQFYAGMSQAGPAASPIVREIFGTLALCSEINGLDTADVRALPAKYRRFFEWLVLLVYKRGLLAAVGAD